MSSSRAAQSQNRSRRRAFWLRLYREVDALFSLDPLEFATTLRMLLRWLVLGSLVGILSGTASAVFLFSLDWATHFRMANPDLLFLLPLAGVLVGWVYHRFAGPAAQGNNLVIEEVNTNQSRIPLRMAPLILLGTVITHLFGGSAGREGTAIQMGASLADTLRRALRLQPEDRRLILMAGISGGFGSVFGTPVAGFVFGLEVQSLGRIRYDGLVPCLSAAVVGDLVARVWGAAHSHYPILPDLALDPVLLLKVSLAGIAFGLTSIAFVELTHAVRRLQVRIVSYAPLRPLLGGLAIILLTLLVGSQDYLGLSLPLIQRSLSGDGVDPFAFLFKLIFTAVTLESGFLGGEVTPLFVVGSTLGFSLGGLLGVDPTIIASIGFVAVFAGASNTPLACALMAMELFGGGAALYIVVGCVMAYLASGHRSIYVTQRVATPKTARMAIRDGETLKSVAERRGGWLPPLPGLTGELSERPVRSIMSSPAIALPADAPLSEIVRLAVTEGVRSLPVVNSQDVVIGIITDDDLHRAGLDANLTRLTRLTEAERRVLITPVQAVPARDLMTAPVISLSHTASLVQAVDLLNAHQLKRLPVVDDAGHLLGILTRSDILREIAAADPGGAHPEDHWIRWEAVVGDVDFEPAVTLSVEDSVEAAVRYFAGGEIKRVLVCDRAGRAVGILTEADLLARVGAEERSQLLAALRGQPNGGESIQQPLAELTTEPLITVRPELSAYRALQLMLDNHIKRLPVVDERGRVLGLVGRAGLMRVLYGQTSEGN
jgi:H+/Cl- antiporter ClcA/CBS domain-containing protein